MRTLRHWWRMVRARKPGIYAYRTRKHRNPFRSEWGYVGRSNRLDLRDGQHAAKPWYDLVKKRYTLPLPWWLGWRWVLAPLETLLILLLLPRYNWQKNPRPGKVGPTQQRLQRQQREGYGGPFAPYAARLSVWVWRAAGVACLVAGIGGALWGR